MSNLIAPFLTLFDSSGNIVSGGKLYFYVTGTTTPQATYSDAARTTPNTNPVVANSAGRVGAIYLDPQKTYKVVCKTSTDTTLWTADPITAADMASGDTTAHELRLGVTPLYFGAVGDGVADEVEFVQEAIDYASENNIKIVSLAGKTYRCDSTLTVPSDISIINGSLDFSNNSSESSISAAGTLGTATTITASVGALATTVNLTSATGFSADQIVLIYDSTNWSTTGSITNGEINKVVSISGTEIALENGLSSQYTSGDGSSVQPVTPVSNVVLRDLSITLGASSNSYGISFVRCTSCLIDNVVVHNNESNAIRIGQSRDIQIQNISFSQSSSNTGTSSVRVEGPSNNVVIDKCTIAESGVFVADAGVLAIGTNRGVARNIRVTNSSFTRCQYGVSFDDGSEICTVSDCAFLRCTYGVRVKSDRTIVSASQFRDNGLAGVLYGPTRSYDCNFDTGSGPGTTKSKQSLMVDGCRMTGNGSGAALSFTQVASTVAVDSFVFTNNQINYTGGISATLAASISNTGFVIRGNKISNGGSFVSITVPNSGSLAGLNVSDNIGTSMTGSFFLATVGSSSGVLTDVTANNNTCDSGTYGIRLNCQNTSNAGRVRLTGNKFSSASSVSFEATYMPSIIASSNAASDAPIGFYFTNCDKSVISDCTASNATGIWINTSDDVQVASCKLVGSETGVLIGNSEDCAVSACMFSDIADIAIQASNCTRFTCAGNTVNMADLSTTAFYTDDVDIFVCTGNNVYGSHDSVIRLCSTPGGADGHNISGNTFAGHSSHAIYCEDNITMSNSIISNNVATGSGTGHFFFCDASTGAGITNSQFSGNFCSHTLVHLDTTLITNVCIANNQVADGHLLKIDNNDQILEDIQIIGNAAFSSASTVINIDETSMNQWDIVGNVFTTNQTSAAMIRIGTGAGSANISDITIMGNTIKGGTYALENAIGGTTTRLVFMNNRLLGQATGRTTGTVTYNRSELTNVATPANVNVYN